MTTTIIFEVMSRRGAGTTAVDADGDADDTDMRVRLQVVMAIMLALATVVMGLRAYVRLRVLRSWGKDDWATLISYIFVLATGILITMSTVYGRGMRFSEIPLQHRQIMVRMANSAMTVYVAAVTCLKAAFLLQYRRIFPLPTFKLICDVVFWFNLLFGISQVITVAVRCSPAYITWTYPVVMPHGAYCIDVYLWWYINAGVNLVTDVIILILPIPMLHSLRLPKKPKIILTGIFGLGIIATAMNIVRINYLKAATVYGMSLAAIFSMVEIGTGMMCLCLPTLRPLIKVGKSRRSSSPIQRRSAPDGGDGPHRVCWGTEPARNTPPHPPWDVEEGIRISREVRVVWTEADDGAEQADTSNEDQQTIISRPRRIYGSVASFSTVRTDNTRSLRSDENPAFKWEPGPWAA